MCDKWYLKDVVGNKILILKKKLIIMYNLWEIFVGDGSNVLVICKKFFLV